MKKNLTMTLLALSLLIPQFAQAGTHVSAKAGVGSFTGSAMSGTNFAFGGEITFGVGGLMQFGGFYDNYDGFNIFGGLARMGFDGTLGFFADAKIGAGEGELSWGVGIGKSSDLGVFSLAPRIGYQTIKVGTVSGGVFDASLLFTLNLP